MGAKQKLNAACLLGCAGRSGRAGRRGRRLWSVFFVALAVLLATAYHAGDLRR